MLENDIFPKDNLIFKLRLVIVAHLASHNPFSDITVEVTCLTNIFETPTILQLSQNKIN